MLKRDFRLSLTPGLFIFITFFTGALAQAKTEPVIPNPDPVAYSWKIVDEAIQSHDPSKRREIVVAASLGGPYDKVFAFLTKAMKDEKVEVRLAACASLASYKDPRSIPPLKVALDDKVPEIVFCAAQALWAMDQPEGEKVLLGILAKDKGISSSYLSAHQRQVMSTFDNKKIFFGTIFRLGIRFAPVPGLAMGFTSMEQLMKDHKAGGQAMAAIDLSHASDPESLKLLVEALKDKSPIVRAAAIHALAMRSDPSVRAELVPLLDDKATTVSFRAAVAYLRLDHIEKTAQVKAAEPAATPAPGRKKK